jgi:hypothetical protein
MVEHAVRIIAIVTSAFVLVSFAMFATDQFAGASVEQRAEVVGADATLPTPQREAQPRRFIDGGARELLRPFAALVTSSNAWGQRTLPTLVALLVYGLGLGFLARSAKGLP